MDTPVSELFARKMLRASGRVLEVSPAQGEASKPLGCFVSTFISVFSFLDRKANRHKKA